MHPWAWPFYTVTMYYYTALPLHSDTCNRVVKRKCQSKRETRERERESRLIEYSKFMIFCVCVSQRERESDRDREAAE